VHCCSSLVTTDVMAAAYGPMDGSMMGPPPEGSFGGGAPPYDPYAPGAGSMMQGQYPTGAAMGTFNGGAGGHDTFNGGGSHAGGEEGHGQRIDKDTGIAPRRCTDIQCCFTWLVFVVCLATMMNMARWHGNVAALTHGRDYYGRVCGVDTGVENMPWLYWCRSDAPSSLPPSGIQLTNPSCVAACPISTNSSVEIPCLRQAESKQMMIQNQQFGNELTQEIEMQESIIYTKPYATRPRGGRFCIPTDPSLESSLLTSWEALNPLGPLMLHVNAGTLGHLEWIFFIVALVAILLGYFFFFCIKHCPKTVTTIFVLPAAIAMGGTAVWLFFAIFSLIPGAQSWGWIVNYREHWNPLYQHYTVVLASWLSIVGCVLCTFIGLALIGIHQTFDAASVADLISAGMGCMKEVPGMFYLPAIEAFIKTLIFIYFLNGLRWFFTVGELHKNRIHVNGARFAGLSREWSFNFWWIFCIAAWLIGFYWFMEISNALFEYLISKCTVTWYFTPKDKGKKVMQGPNPIISGAQDAVLYHWGSIAYGGFWIPYYRPVRFAYWISSCKDCCGLKAWSKEKVESPEALIKDGFSDIVIRANDFAPASEKAHMLLEHSHRVVQYMYRDQSQTTLCILGVGGIATVCSWVTFMITNFAKIYTVESSNLYLANPNMVVFLSWILGAYIAFGFMSSWDHTSDSLLYCYAWNRKFSRKTVEKFIPEAVRAIVGFDDKEDDRYPFYGRAKTNMYLRSWITVNDKTDKKKANQEKPPVKLETPEPSWAAQRTWMGGSQAPMPAPGGPMEMQSLLPK